MPVAIPRGLVYPVAMTITGIGQTILPRTQGRLSYGGAGGPIGASLIGRAISALVQDRRAN